MEHRKLRRYAGEFAVIVLGVMMGLGADRWVQGLDSRAEEQRVLSALISDLVTDSTEVAAMVRGEEFRREAIARFVGIAGGAPPAVTDSTRFALSFLRLGYSNPPNPARSAWDVLIGGGELGAISNPEIRMRLGQYYEEWDALELYERDFERLFWIVQERLMLIGAPEDRMALVGMTYGSEPPERPEGYVEMAIEALRSDDELVQVLSELHNLSRGRAVLYSEFLGEVEAVLASSRHAVL